MDGAEKNGWVEIGRVRRGEPKRWSRKNQVTGRIRASSIEMTKFPSN